METRDRPAHHVDRKPQIWPPDWQTLERIDQDNIDRRVVDLHDVERILRDRGRAENRLRARIILSQSCCDTLVDPVDPSSDCGFAWR